MLLRPKYILKLLNMWKVVFLLLIFNLLNNSTYSQSKKVKDIEKLVHEWAIANNRQDLEKLESLYARNVMFYGQSKNASACISDKASFFKQNNYAISISDIDVDFYERGAIKCNFTKDESWKKINRRDKAYLVFEKRSDQYLIVAEGDQRMDSKTGVDLDLGPKIYKKTSWFYR